MRRVLAIRHHVEDDPGLLGEGFAARGYDVHTVMLDAHNPEPLIDGYDCVLVLGSNCSVYDPQARSEFVDRELALLGDAHQRGVPILGVCFGAQLLCALFGGTVEPAPRGEKGWFDIDVRSDLALSRGPWFEYHEDRCILPEGADLWASTAVAVQAFAIGAHVGVQFHPEIDDVQLARWFISESPEPRAHTDHESALLDQTRAETPAARVRAAALVDLFLAHAGLFD